MLQIYKLRHFPPTMGRKQDGSHFLVSAVAAAWKGIVKSGVEGGFPCFTFSGGENSFHVPQFQLR